MGGSSSRSRSVWQDVDAKFPVTDPARSCHNVSDLLDIITERFNEEELTSVITKLQDLVELVYDVTEHRPFNQGQSPCKNKDFQSDITTFKTRYPKISFNDDQLKMMLFILALLKSKISGIIKQVVKNFFPMDRSFGVMFCQILCNSILRKKRRKVLKTDLINDARNIMFQAIKEVITEGINGPPLLNVIHMISSCEGYGTSIIDQEVQYEISLNCSNLVEEDVVALSIAIYHCTYLKKLSLGWCRLKSPFLQMLDSRLQSSKVKIIELDVSGNKDMDFSILGLFSKKYEVKKLSMSSCSLNSKKLDAFLKKSGKRKIIEVDVSRNQGIGSEGLSSLFNLIKKHSVAKLIMRFCGLNYKKLDGVKRGSVLREIFSTVTKFIDISDNKLHFTEEEIADLQKNLHRINKNNLEVKVNDCYLCSSAGKLTRKLTEKEFQVEKKNDGKIISSDTSVRKDSLKHAISDKKTSTNKVGLASNQSSKLISKRVDTTKAEDMLGHLQEGVNEMPLNNMKSSRGNEGGGALVVASDNANVQMTFNNSTFNIQNYPTPQGTFHRHSLHSQRSLPEGWTVVSSSISFYQDEPIVPDKHVYRAAYHHVSGVNEDIVVKLLQKSAKRQKEVDKLVKLVNHRNIVRILGSGIYSDAQIFIAMERCRQNLRQYINQNSSNLAKSESFFHQTVLAVNFIHSRNIIHRDLKPENILISLCGDFIKVCDFGISKDVPENNSVVANTCHGVGTEGFKPPETYHNHGQVGYKSDVYSLAITGFFIFSHGHHPFGDNPLKWALNITENTNLDLSLIPNFPQTLKRRKLTGLLTKMLSFNYRHRPTAEEVKNNVFFEDSPFHCKISSSPKSSKFRPKDTTRKGQHDVLLTADKEKVNRNYDHEVQADANATHDHDSQISKFVLNCFIVVIAIIFAVALFRWEFFP